MASDAASFFEAFFHELEQRGVPYVILHSYQEMPERIPGDIDYAVPHVDLPKLRKIQIELARRHGWALVQTIQHGVFAFFGVLVNSQNPTENLKLDACSSYARACRFLVPESVLLAKRIPHRGFYIPAPASEFIYVLAKLYDAKNKSPAQYLPRLKELWLKEPPTAQKYFNDLFGDTGRNLAEWFERPAEEWSRLRAVMLARNWFGPVLMLREGGRIVKRVLKPTGFCLAILGSDDAGKSTLVARLRALLAPCFRYQKVLHFGPRVFQEPKQGIVADPHGRAPRNILASWLKVFYYFAEHWAGWLSVVQHGRICSMLVIFDRSFDDLLVDQRRYRLRGTSVLVRILRRFLPKADRTFVLSAPAQLLHQRKSELPIEELERQRATLCQLAASDPRYVLVSTEASVDEVARVVCRHVINFLAERERKRCTKLP